MARKKDLEDMAKEEVLKVFDRMSPDIVEAKGRGSSDGLNNIRQYVKDAYGVILGDKDYSVQKMSKEVRDVQVIQNGVELSRVKRIRNIAEDKYEKLMKDKPIKILNVLGRSYVINGNHRLLDHYMRDRKEINAEVYVIRDRETARKLDLSLKRQIERIVDEYGFQNVCALRVSLCRQMKDYIK